MSNSVNDIIDNLKSSLMDDDAAKYLNEYSEIFNKIISEGLINKIKTGKFDFIDPDKAIKASQLFDQGIELNPAALIEKQVDYMQSQMKLWQQTTLSLITGDTDNDIIKPERGDRRFKSDDWDSNPLFRLIKQSYLLNAKFINTLSDTMTFEDDEKKDKIDFYLRQFSNSLSPTNFAASNPDVCKEIVRSKGENLKNGLKNFLSDLENSPENTLSISMADTDAFSVGENIGITAGKVVFQNDLIQLVQYEPQTETVFKTPIFLTSAFINKFYILDLTPENSMIDWLVKQGHTVFATSWVNADDSHGDITFDDYMLKGPIAAQQAITEITGEKDIHAIGYCAGATILACAQSYLTTSKQTPFKTTTYLTALMDFSSPGELGVYITEDFISAVENQDDGTKVFDGRKIGLGFSLLRENNLYWSNFINNYLMGKDPAAFDLLYWNTDASNMPINACSYYLRNMYQNNKMIEPGGITLGGEPIDLSKIKKPAYFLSTLADHIAQWESTYPGAKIHSGDTRFVLAGSGHIAGVINPPSANKYGYWTNEELPDTPKEWMDSSTNHDGSWWLDWHEWASAQSGKKVSARAVGEHQNYPALEDAPGSYVKVQCSDIFNT